MALYDAQVGATVGRGEYRVQAAEALIASMKSSAASSPETGGEDLAGKLQNRTV